MSNKNKKRVAGKGFKKFTLFLLLFLLFILLLVVVFFILNSYNIDIFKFNKSDKIQEYFSIRDECSYIAGQLIHSINTADECKLKCRSECYSSAAEYGFAEFTLSNDTSCNSCQCLCN